eukprot:16432218-Heterocapsa_arctica.AAC.1
MPLDGLALLAIHHSPPSDALEVSWGGCQLNSSDRAHARHLLNLRDWRDQESLTQATGHMRGLRSLPRLCTCAATAPSIFARMTQRCCANVKRKVVQLAPAQVLARAARDLCDRHIPHLPERA